MRALVLAFMAAVLAVVVVACSSNGPCGAANCGTCCGTNGCVTSVSDAECGSAGNSCVACMTGFQCSGGKCLRTGPGGGAGGSGGATGGGTGGSGGATGGGTGGGSGGATGGGTGGSGGGMGITCPGGALPAAVPISFPPTCTVPTPCGGNPSGKYDYTGACVGQDEFGSFVSRLEQVCGAGSVTVTGYDGGIQGFAFFQAGHVCRTVQGSVTVSATIGGAFCPMYCTTIGMGIAQAGFTGSCAQNGAVCDCTATRAINLSTMGSPYTTSATTLTITPTGQHYETCLTGNVLTTRQLDAGTGGEMAREPGVATLTKP